MSVDCVAFRINCISYSHVVAEINKFRSFDFLGVGVNGDHWLEVWSRGVDQTENVLDRVEQYCVQVLYHVTRSLSRIPDTPVNRDGQKNTAVFHIPIGVSTQQGCNFRRVRESHGLQPTAL